jgi:4-amino-4-deoxy-L-arabinose transferase-like glycosyltransferase
MKNKSISADFGPKKETPEQPTKVARFTSANILKFISGMFGKFQTQVFLILVFGLALFLRLWQLATLPPGVSAAENIIIEQIKNLSVGNLWLGSRFYQAAYVYSGFAVGKIFGLNVLNLRIMSAIFGALTILLTYIFIAKWFSKKIAIFTAFLFSISAFHITLSRLVLPDVMMPMILLLLFVILTEAYRTKNIWLFGASGVLVALGLYTSPAFLIVPLLFVTTGIYFFYKNKKFFSSYRQEIIIAAIAFFAAVIPYAVSFYHNPVAYLTFFGFNRSIWQIILNISQVPYMFIIGTPVNYFVNLGAEPLLDPFISITAISGVVIAVMSASRRKYFFLLSWIGLFVLYASLKRGVQIPDLVGILPVIYVFSALALDYVIEKWFATFPLNKRAQLLAIAIISIFFALSAVYNFDRYFVGYKNSILVKKEFSAKPIIPLK